MKNEILVVTVDELINKLNSTIQTSISEQENKNAVIKEQEFSLINTEQLCKMLGVSRITIYNWRKKGILPYKKISKLVYFDLHEVQKALKSYNLGSLHTCI
jgi:predicted DNA-binding transcriptional regulator AlpA